PMTEEQRQQEYNKRQPFDTSKVVKTDECKPKAAPRKKRQDNKPSAPKNLTTSDITSESCHLHWQKPDHENGSPITKYIVQICKSGEKDWKEAGSSTTTDTVVHGLQRRTQYLFRVAAENEVGIGAFGELSAHKTTEDSSEWEYHDENTAKAKCGDSIVLKVPFKGAKPSVSLLHNDGPVQNMTRVKAEIIDSCVCCRLQEVDLADQGEYTLTVENDTGRGTVVANLIVLERLPAPQNLTANWTTPVSCQVNWQEPVDLVGSKIKVYVVEMYLKEGKHYSTPNSYQCDTTFLNIKDLDSNNQYLFRVAAKNEVGIGEFTALQGLKTVKNIDGNEDSQLFIPVRVHIGGENECIDAVFKSSSEYLKWMFVIQNNEAAKQLSSPETKQPSRSEVVVENGEIAVTLSHKSDRKQKVEAVNDCLQTSINKLTDILVACFEGNGNESKISEIIEQSELVKEHNLYIHFDKRLQKIYLVCFVNLVEHVDKEFRQALVKVKSDFKGHFGIDLEYQYESKISFSNVEEAITSKFPEVHFEYTADYRKRSCICYLQGQSIVELEKAKQFVQQEVGRFTYNSFSFSEIKNIHAIDDELAVEYLNMEIKGMCEASSFEGLHIEVDSEEKRVVIAGCKQTDVDNLASKVKSCISHKSFQLQASEKSQKEFLSNMVSKFHGRIFGSFREGNCHCYGSSEVMKMIQEHIAKQEGEKKNPCKEILDEVSSDLKMQTKINRFAVIKKFDTFHFIKDKVDMEDLKLGSDVSVIIKETSDKFGFLIQGTEESIVNLENTIHIVESQVQEKEMSVKVLNGQMEIYEACTREIERDCNVLIKKLQETDFPCESVPQRKQWAFVGGQTLIISCDSAQKQWKDLFVELKQVRQIDKELKPQLKKNGNRKVTELFIPTYSKDEDAGKQKHFLQDSTEKVLKQALHCQCTHICIPVEELYGWPLEKFVKQIFHVVIEQFKHISNKLPMVIELCLPKKEDFMECCDIAANAMPETVSELSDDSETDEGVHSDGKGISVVIENGKLDETE
ncbi:uncharacterized protein LOC128554367, partial [Mercenaria mercenaria]|uniref:uncharacterized protein LOC128554367 n=1 Tax=Mercenaria mercenaria TaxID=6596 RepID=UPI00234F6E5A